VLLQATGKSIVKIMAPGECESITTDSSDQLVASIRKTGIFLYDEDHWVRLANHPYPSGEGEYWAHFAQNGSDLAFAMTDKNGTAPTQLLVFHGGSFQLIRIR
jgi:hypothetical protein